MRNTCALLLAAAVLVGCSPRGTSPTGSGADSSESVSDPRGPFPASWYIADASDMGNMVNLVGQPMPELHLSDWRDGQLGPEDLAGKVVILDFWATWCGPCIASMPHNNEVYRQFRDRGAMILGICTADGQEDMAEIAEQKGVIYPLAKDPSGATAAAFHVPFFPTYIAVDRDGIIRAVGLAPNHLEEVIEKLLNEQPAAAPAETETEA